MAADQLSIIHGVRGEVERTALRARNGIKMAIGVSRPDVGRTPKDVVWSSGRAELWHYHNDDVRYSPPLLVIPSLVSRSYILDLTPGNSFIEQLVGAGLDVYMLDWGVADERDAANRFEDYVDLAIPAAIRRVRRRSGADGVNLLGYCLGGVLTLLHAAHHPSSPLRSLTVVACPVDFRRLGPLGDIFGTTDLEVDAVLGDDGNIPPRVVLRGFRSLAPMGEITANVNLLDRLWSDEYVAAHQAMTGWATDHVPFPGATARQMAQMLRDNALVTGRMELGGDRVSLADIEVPFLSVLGTRDHIIPEPASAPVLELIGSADKHELRLDGGHVGLIVGRTAQRTTIPTLVEFLIRRSRALS
ncbi:MAG TPA: alpha/beta fold hydrolase [Kineosporiaceae bacterium]|nr:alpha/beta fold hydrolase [Kineosporiaceae bacterium]